MNTNFCRGRTGDPQVVEEEVVGLCTFFFLTASMSWKGL